MATSDIVAYLGAAAWIPQILGWIAAYFVTPVVDLFPNVTVELGYTHFGPIFNLMTAISTDRKDAVIKRISAHLRHESGQEFDLIWRTMNETFSHIRNASGDTTEVRKDQVAIALKVSTYTLTEKNIGFRDQSFETKAAALLTKVVEHKAYLEKANKDIEKELPISQPFIALVDFMEKASPWKPGKYKATLNLDIAEVRAPTIIDLEFNLSGNDIDLINKNIANIKPQLLEIAAPPLKPTNFAWNWTYPVVTRNPR